MARRALGPSTLAVVQAVEAALTEADHSLLVACSGGPDSLALAQAVAHVGQRRTLPIAAAVVDHGLQSSSSEVAQGVAETLAGLGFADVTLRSVVVEQTGAGPEGDARAARYRALEQAARERGATVLLGHTRDDQAESVLLGLVRGSGTRSLAGMARRSGMGGGRWLRPLLELRRSVTVEVCRENDLVPWHDPHNESAAFTRVRVRRGVLPVLERELGPGIVEALARTATLARDDADLLDALAADADPGTATLDCAALETLPAALRRRVLGRWLRLEHGLGDLSAGHLVAVDALLTNWHGQVGVDLPGAVRVRRTAGRLAVAPHPAQQR